MPRAHAGGKWMVEHHGLVVRLMFFINSDFTVDGVSTTLKNHEWQSCWASITSLNWRTRPDEDLVNKGAIIFSGTLHCAFEFGFLSREYFGVTSRGRSYRFVFVSGLVCSGSVLHITACVMVVCWLADAHHLRINSAKLNQEVKCHRACVLSFWCENIFRPIFASIEWWVDETLTREYFQ